MTEFEARIIIEGYLGDDEVINEAIEIAGKALEEVQKYREFEEIFKEYFSDDAIAILSDKKCFTEWLEHISKKCKEFDEISRELERAKKELDYFEML